ncbi:MAG TPA: lysozyme inhibitor LprI family protein [Candidatus Angelobacter sp.]|nr:lysozyme inhibitor LprI family protein [Candidatus Angelobacter sp.]
MKYLSLVFLLAALDPGLAQDSAHYRSCNEKAKTQMEMNVCASEEAARADTELNEAYRRVLIQAGKDEESVAKIKAAERAWIAYRDAYMEAMYPAKNKQAEYGSIYPMEADLLRAKLTQRQVIALKELLQQYSGNSGTSQPLTRRVL